MLISLHKNGTTTPATRLALHHQMPEAIPPAGRAMQAQPGHAGIPGAFVHHGHA